METELTRQLKLDIFKATSKQGTFGCFEVTIGWFGHERVDYMTYSTDGTWRCYEVKISKQDFRSDNHNTFIGHLNYYVMPQELFDKVKTEIPKEVGVFVGGCCVKKAKRQDLKVEERILKDSLIRSLSREVEKQIRSGNQTLIDIYRREIAEERREKERYRKEYWELKHRVYELEHPERQSREKA